jgi:hypothetical protein
MKKLYKISLLVCVIGIISSCDLDLLDNPNAVTPDNASVELLMNNVFVEFAQLMDEVGDETMQFVRQITMQGSQFYAQAEGPETYDYMWGQMYSTILPDLNLIIEKATADGIPGYSGVAKVLKAYVLFTAVDLFGDVPYSDAFQGTNKLSPVNDDDEAVYNEALAILNSGIEDLTNTPAAYRLVNDTYYGGVPAQWLKLANTLKLRYYLNTRHVNGNALSEINNIVAAGNYIATRADDFEQHYGVSREAVEANDVNEGPDSRHPYYADGYESGGPSIYMANYYMWAMFGDKETEDPRIRYYFYRQDCDETDENTFTLGCQLQPYPFHWPDGYPFCTASFHFTDPDNEYGGYWGRDHGDDQGIPPDDLKRTAWGVFPAGGKFDADNCASVSNSGTDGLKGAGIQPVVLASYVHFMLAEARLTGGDAASARTSLEAGVRESIGKTMAFGAADADPDYIPTTDQIEAYVAEVLAAYDAANDDGKLNVIMKEYWLASVGQGLEAYNGYRRTCKPEAMQPSLEQNPGPFPRTLWYPASFVNRNENVDQKANLEVKVFWDANPNGCILQ